MTLTRRNFFPAVTLASAAAAGLATQGHAHDHGAASTAAGGPGGGEPAMAAGHHDGPR